MRAIVFTALDLAMAATSATALALEAGVNKYWDKRKEYSRNAR